MSRRKLAASIDEKKEAGEILKSIFFDGNDDETTGIWLHDHLQKRSPGVEKILAADDGTGSSELPDEKLPRTLVDMFGSEVFEGANGAELRGKILDKLFERGEYKKIFQIFLGSSSASNATIEDMIQAFGPRLQLSRVHLRREYHYFPKREKYLVSHLYRCVPKFV